MKMSELFIRCQHLLRCLTPWSFLREHHSEKHFCLSSEQITSWETALPSAWTSAPTSQGLLDGSPDWMLWFHFSLAEKRRLTVTGSESVYLFAFYGRGNILFVFVSPRCSPLQGRLKVFFFISVVTLKGLKPSKYFNFHFFFFSETLLWRFNRNCIGCLATAAYWMFYQEVLRSTGSVSVVQRNNLL